MKTIEQINADYIKALKGKNELSLSVLRMLRSSLKNKEIELRKELDESEVLSTIRSEIKKRNDSIESFKVGNRSDLVDAEASEIEILKVYLSPELSEKEVLQKVEKILADLPESTKANFGQAMGVVMKELKDQANGNLISKVVKDLLQK